MKIHVKPNFYTYCFEDLKIIAKRYGYNLVIHGSMNRDMDLIAIPWSAPLGNVEFMVDEFAEYLDGHVMPLLYDQKKCFPYGRESRIIEMKRRFDPRGNFSQSEDKQYYLDISIIPSMIKCTECGREIPPQCCSQCYESANMGKEPHQ